MKHALYSVSNLLLHIAHLTLIFLILAGWWFCGTRLLSDLLILATLASWYGLKPVFAKDSDYGYCLITDIQWKLRRRLGLSAPNGGYMKFLADLVTGGDFDSDVIEKATAMLLFACFAGALVTTSIFGWC